jgi:transcription antitermination factor NusG
VRKRASVEQFEIGQQVQVAKPDSAFNEWQGTVEEIHPCGGGATVMVRLSVGGMVFLDDELEPVEGQEGELTA